MARTKSSKANERVQQLEKDAANSKKRAAAIGVATAVISVTGGFLLGIASDDSTAYTERADACFGALSGYLTTIGMFPAQASLMSDPRNDVELRNEAVHGANETQMTADQILNKCPVQDGDSQYLNENDVKGFLGSNNAILQECLIVPRCSYEQALELVDSSREAVLVMMADANLVHEWGIVKKGYMTVLRVF